MPETAIVVLAAGASSRMGAPKQLLALAGRPLVRRAAETAIAAGCGPVLVVVGPHSGPIEDALARLPVHIVPNPRWREGIGTSIGAGVEAAIALEVGAVMIALADQPLITPAALSRLAAAHRASGRPIAASRYAGTIGVPAVFARSIASALLALPPDEGCKRVLRAAGPDLILVDCPEAETDVDSPADFARIAQAHARGD